MRVQMHDRCTMQLSTKWLSLLYNQEKHCVQVPSQQRRKSHQRYVFFLMESPLNDGLNYTNKRFAFDFFRFLCLGAMCSPVYFSDSIIFSTGQ